MKPVVAVYIIHDGTASYAGMCHGHLVRVWVRAVKRTHHITLELRSYVSFIIWILELQVIWMER